MSIKDIYFDHRYAKLNELVDCGEACEFTYKDELGSVRNLFIKRPIQSLGLIEKAYDITTPYGYGGPLIEELKGNGRELVKRYHKAFSNYCQQEGIVSEFIRFHPILNNASDFKEIYDPVFVRQTVATELSGADPFQEEFSKSTRKMTRKALEEDVEVRITSNPQSIDGFKKVYYDSMDRNQASAYYYFSDDYFDRMVELFRDKIVVIDVFLQKQCIASGLYLVYGDFMHAHLSGTKQEYLHLSPAYILKYYSVRYGKEKGCRYIHYGGGRSNAPDDGLFLFKKKFTRNGLFDFYVAKNIYIEDIYEQLVEATKTQDSDFFPKYREKRLK